MSDWTKLQTELLWAYESVIRPSDLKLPKDIAPGIPIYYIKKGQLTLESNIGQTVISEGQWVIVTQKLNGRDFVPDSEIISIRLMLNRPDGRSFFDEREPRTFTHADYPQLMERSLQLIANIREQMPTAYTDLWRRLSDLDGYLAIQELFFGWLRCLIGICSEMEDFLNPYAGMDERMEAALEILDALPLYEEMLEANLAQRVGLSISQLNRLFAKWIGETPKHYWDSRRLNAATSRLSASATPIKQLAHELGFSSQNYFARWFRVQTGCTPREYRERFSQTWDRYRK